MIRHVVTFLWSPTADEQRRNATLEALRGLPETVGCMTEFVVAEDAGLREGNVSAVLIADFPDEAAYLKYAEDPVHQAVIAEHVLPILAARQGLQYRW